MSESRGDDDRDDEEWAVTLEDLEDDGDERPAPEPIEPGAPTVEGVAFVVLGVALTVVVVLAGI